MPKQTTLVKLSDFSPAELLARFKAYRSETGLKTPYPDDLVQQAIKHHQKRNLRFNLKSGITRDRDGEQGSFCDGHYKPFEFVTDDALFDLMGWIYNFCSRFQRGLSM